MRRVVGLLVVVLLAFIAATLATGLAPAPACTIGSGYDLLCARGFETRETAYGESFRWSNATAEIHLPHAGYGSPLLLTLRLRSGRPANFAAVPAHIGIHGRTLAAITVPPTNRRYSFLLPAPHFPIGDSARVQVQSGTWKPNILSRTFGIILLSARLDPIASPNQVIPHLPSLSLIASWLALLLTAQLTLTPKHAIPDYQKRAGTVDQRAKNKLMLRLFLGCYPMVFVPLCWWMPALLSLLPMVALVVGSSILIWQYVYQHTATTEHAPHTAALWWAMGVAIPYMLIIITTTPTWAKLGLLIASGSIAVVGALRWGASVRVVSPLVLVSLAMSGGLSRLLLLAARVVSGNTRLDADVELFYAYGMALRGQGLPEVEYPAGALMPWTVLSWLSGDSRELFALLLPLFNIGCDMLMVIALGVLGGYVVRHTYGNGNAKDQMTHWLLAPAAFYAFSPLLEPFVFGKYDPLPALLTVGTLALFALQGRITTSLAGLTAGLGGMIKWTPILVMPFLGLDLLRQRRWRALGGMVVWHFAALLLCSLPFALTNMHTFLMPYQVQGGKGMTGESIWMLVAFLRDPTVLAALDAPWGMLRRGKLPVSLMVGVQGGALVLLGSIAMLRPRSLPRTLMLAALAPTVFLILNRIFSPQYMLSISASLLAVLAIATPLRSQKTIYLWLGLLALAQISNLLIWPFFVGSSWLLASLLFFVVLVVLSVWACALCYNTHTSY